ncbi:hypothetical protein [Paenibacillus humicola]|uniref:hypothetical protein n=1 Tax=Paenibacillus humicola TaxID=3110540 RepID=UPI00237AA63A|nr:hypothetical protein [Paenibacillus humicola]
MERREKEAESTPGSMEEALAERLESGPMDNADKERETLAKLKPKYEIRIQTVHDPVVAETKRYRQLAGEIDDRYDKYMKRAGDGSLTDGKDAGQGKGG